MGGASGTLAPPNRERRRVAARGGGEPRAAADWLRAGVSPAPRPRAGDWRRIRSSQPLARSLARRLRSVAALRPARRSPVPVSGVRRRGRAGPRGRARQRAREEEGRPAEAAGNERTNERTAGRGGGGAWRPGPRGGSGRRQQHLRGVLLCLLGRGGTEGRWRRARTRGGEVPPPLPSGPTERPCGGRQTASAPPSRAALARASPSRGSPSSARVLRESGRRQCSGCRLVPPALLGSARGTRPCPPAPETGVFITPRAHPPPPGLGAPRSTSPLHPACLPGACLCLRESILSTQTA